MRPTRQNLGDGNLLVEFTDRAAASGEDIIRRHRLAERLFTETLNMDNETEIEQQACKFEHILSPEATERICSFLRPSPDLSARLPHPPRDVLRQAAGRNTDVGRFVAAVRA